MRLPMVSTGRIVQVLLAFAIFGKFRLHSQELLAIVCGMDTSTEKAIQQAGGKSALAKALGVSYQAIQQWARIPAPRVLEVERLSGISRYELRPDIYGPQQ
jgi:hypothetical protein